MKLSWADGRVKMRMSSVSGTDSVPKFKACCRFGSTETGRTPKMGNELIPETSDNFLILTQPAA